MLWRRRRRRQRTASLRLVTVAARYLALGSPLEAAAERFRGLCALYSGEEAGRGRAGRAWQSTAGNLHLSVLLRPGGPARDIAGYALLAAEQGAKVVLSVHDPLRRLFKDFDPRILVIGQKEEPSEFDLHCPLLSLPLAFGTKLETIPTWPEGYLKAPAEEVAAWAQRLPAGRRRIGLAWSGSTLHQNDSLRSIPLAKLTPLFQSGDVWVSVQKDPRDRDRTALEASGIFDPTAELGDFADTAALISALDLVITVDTSVAHLAGALGKPVWVMLPFAPDFRWMLRREDSPWYPSMRLFRQRRPCDWEDVVARLNAALATDMLTQ
jgi:hypothetical protein